jgi:hypothetical protein
VEVNLTVQSREHRGVLNMWLAATRDKARAQMGPLLQFKFPEILPNDFRNGD